MAAAVGHPIAVPDVVVTFVVFVVAVHSVAATTFLAAAAALPSWQFTCTSQPLAGSEGRSSD